MSHRAINAQPTFEDRHEDDFFNNFVPIFNGDSRDIQNGMPEEYLDKDELQKVINGIDGDEYGFDVDQEIIHHFSEDDMIFVNAFEDNQNVEYDVDFKNKVMMAPQLQNQMIYDPAAYNVLGQQQFHHQTENYVMMNDHFINGVVYQDANGIHEAPERFDKHYEENHHQQQPQELQYQVFEDDTVFGIVPEHQIIQQNGDFVVMEVIDQDANGYFEAPEVFEDVCDVDFHQQQPQQFLELEQNDQHWQVVGQQIDGHLQYAQENQENQTPLLHHHQFNLPNYAVGIDYQQRLPQQIMRPVPTIEPLHQQFVETPAAKEANELLDKRPTVDIDTKKLVVDLKKSLKNSNFSQKLFGWKILNCSQSHLCNTMKSPPPFHAMGKGQAIFIRMFNWIMLTEEEKVAIWNLELHPVKETMPSRKCGSFKLGDDINEFLEEKLRAKRFPTAVDMEQYALEAGIKKTTVLNWFKKQRKNHHKRTPKVTK